MTKDTKKRFDERNNKVLTLFERTFISKENNILY